MGVVGCPMRISWQVAKDMGMTSCPSSWPSPGGLLSPSSLSHAFATSSVRFFCIQFTIFWWDEGLESLEDDVLLRFRVLKVSDEA